MQGSLIMEEKSKREKKKGERKGKGRKEKGSLRETVSSELRWQFDQGQVGGLQGEGALRLRCVLGPADWGSGPGDRRCRKDFKV